MVTPWKINMGSPENTPMEFRKIIDSKPHDFRFKLLIFGSVIFWDFRLCLHQCLGWIQVGVSADFSILRLGFCLDSPFQKAWNLQSELRKLKTSIANCLNSGWFRGDPYETWIKICNAINKAFCCSHDLMHHDASCANLHTFESEDMSSWFRHHIQLCMLYLGYTPTSMEASPPGLHL